MTNNSSPFITTSHAIAAFFDRDHKRVIRAIRAKLENIHLDDSDEREWHHLNYLVTTLSVKIGSGVMREIPGYLITLAGAKKLVEGFSGAKAKEIAAQFLAETLELPEQPERGVKAPPPQEPPKAPPASKPTEAEEYASKVPVTQAEAFVKMQEICDARVEAFESENAKLTSENTTLKAHVMKLEESNDPAFLNAVVLRLIRAEQQRQALIDEGLALREIYERALDSGIARHKCDLRFTQLGKIGTAVANHVADLDSRIEGLIASLKK